MISAAFACDSVAKSRKMCYHRDGYRTERGREDGSDRRKTSQRTKGGAGAFPQRICTADLRLEVRRAALGAVLRARLVRTRQDHSRRPRDYRRSTLCPLEGARGAGMRPKPKRSKPRPERSDRRHPKPRKRHPGERGGVPSRERRRPSSYGPSSGSVCRWGGSSSASSRRSSPRSQAYSRNSTCRLRARRLFL